jgi:RNA polymerase sigma factor (TIGR02999 family)
MHPGGNAFLDFLLHGAYRRAGSHLGRRLSLPDEIAGMEPPPAKFEAPPIAPGDAAADGADITGLLMAWRAGDEGALNDLLPIVYAELRRQARRALRREAGGHTLQPTALVHEAYLKLIDQQRAHWESRTQFFAVAAQLMRRILVDHARARRRTKRGGGATQVTLPDVAASEDPTRDFNATSLDTLDLDEALTRFAVLDPNKARLVELRYFAGLSIPEAAAALGVSPATVGRDWAVARAWLRRELSR